MKDNRGYIVCVTNVGSNALIPAVEHIEVDATNPKFESDYDAAKQAEKDGIKIIHDMPGVEDWTYVDTPENRALIMAWLKANPKYDTRSVAADEWEASRLVDKYNGMLQRRHGTGITVKLHWYREDDDSIWYYYTSAKYGDSVAYETAKEAYKEANTYLNGVGELW